MAKGWYIGNESNIARKVKRMYIGDGNDVARKVKKVYIGDENGKARLAYSSGLGKIIVGHYGKNFSQANSYGVLTPLSMPNTVTVAGIPFIVFGADRFVTVITKESGSGSSTEKMGAYSFDGVTWYPSDINLMNSSSDWWVKFLGYINGYYIILYSKGQMVFSTDGINWTWFALRSDTLWDCVEYANGYYYVSGRYASWTIKFPVLNTNPERTYAYSGNIAGICANPTGTIMVGYLANNGIVKYDFATTKWNVVSTIVMSSGSTQGSVYANGKFVMTNTNFTNHVYYSYDGVSWTSVDLPRQIFTLSFDGANFIAGSTNGYYMYSSDAINWTLSPIVGMGANTTAIYSIAGN
ncbi:MAG TPA: hypothetical protein DCE48_05375 [Lachnospiraceae bacterium]|nr:hypothetical protein [Lachnospiraceae bacterium]